MGSSEENRELEIPPPIPAEYQKIERELYANSQFWTKIRISAKIPLENPSINIPSILNIPPRFRYTKPSYPGMNSTSVYYFRMS